MKPTSPLFTDLRDAQRRNAAPGALLLGSLPTAPDVTTNDTMNYEEQPRPDADSANKNDGGEPTPPSQEGEPIVKPEPLGPQKCITSSPGVTPNRVGDIFDDLAALGRTLEELTPSEKVLTSLTIRKPKKDEWVRCHGEIHTAVNLYENADKTFYLVLPAALEAMDDVVKSVRLRLAVTYSGDVFVWPVPIPSLQRPYPAHVSASAAAEAAAADWIRMAWKTTNYEVYRRRDAGKEPEWPEQIPDASEMLRFVSKSGGFEVIDSPHHSVVRELRGLA